VKRMRWQQPLLRAGEYLVARSCRYLPSSTRDERYREWTAELPAILDDPGTQPAWRRAVRMLCYAADTIRGTARASRQAKRRARRHPYARRTALIGLRIIPELAAAAFILWFSLTASGNRITHLLTVSFFYGAFRLARLAVRTLWSHRPGRT
jgi:hypothetical protein